MTKNGHNSYLRIKLSGIGHISQDAEYMHVDSNINLHPVPNNFQLGWTWHTRKSRNSSLSKVNVKRDLRNIYLKRILFPNLIEILMEADILKQTT